MRSPERAATEYKRATRTDNTVRLFKDTKQGPKLIGYYTPSNGRIWTTSGYPSEALRVTASGSVLPNKSHIERQEAVDRYEAENPF